MTSRSGDHGRNGAAAARRFRLLLVALGCAAAAGAFAGASPEFVPDLTQACPHDAASNLRDWRISGALERKLRPLRIECRDGAAALRVTVHPGDAYDPNPDASPTERVELQLRREMVRFDEATSYGFGFRLVAPWPSLVNRTVIHQVKQNIEPAYETGHGGTCPGANPFFKIEAGGDGHGAVFVVKVRGTGDCRDGRAAIPICGPWPLSVGAWHRVEILLKPSQTDGASDLRVALDGRSCPRFTGAFGYLDHGKHDAAGRPLVDVQPRFGIYRDALAELSQTIEFADIAFKPGEGIEE